jgi:uncharacterized protein YjbJ (UPF0337 family)
LVHGGSVRVCVAEQFPALKTAATGKPPSATATRVQEATFMGDGDTDKAKGNIKEAAGDLTGDKDLQREGQVDQASGSVKDKVGDAADSVKDALKRD